MSLAALAGVSVAFGLDRQDTFEIGAHAPSRCHPGRTKASPQEHEDRQVDAHREQVERVEVQDQRHQTERGTAHQERDAQVMEPWRQ